MSEFGGKVALITGTTGIALATARRLASGGAAIVACGIVEEANAALQAELMLRTVAEVVEVLMVEIIDLKRHAEILR